MVIDKDSITEEELKRFSSGVRLTGQLYFDKELKVCETNFGKPAAFFNLLVCKKNPHKGIVSHRLYCKCYNEGEVDYLIESNVGDWLTIEGVLESVSGRNYVNVRSIYRFDSEGNPLSRDELKEKKGKNPIWDKNRESDDEDDLEPDALSFTDELMDSLMDNLSKENISKDKKRKLAISIMELYRNIIQNPGSKPDIEEPDEDDYRDEREPDFLNYFPDTDSDDIPDTDISDREQDREDDKKNVLEVKRNKIARGIHKAFLERKKALEEKKKKKKRYF